MRNHNPRITYMNIANTKTPEMRYDDKGDFTKWQSDARTKLRDLLGLDLLKKCDNIISELGHRFYAEKGYKAFNIILGR